MAQYHKENEQYVDRNNNLFDVVMLADKDGNIINSSSIASNIPISNGSVEGYSVEHINGAVPSMSQNTTGTIWDINDTNYPWEAWNTPNFVTINTGTEELNHQVILHGLDEFGDHLTEIVELTATSVQSINKFSRLHYCLYKDGNIQNINDINFIVNGILIARIPAGRGQTSMGIFSVPKGHTAYILKGVSSCQANADASVDMFVKYGGQTNYSVGHSFEISGTGGQYIYDFAIPFMLPEFSDIDIKTSVRSNNARITCAFEILLIQN